MSDLNFVRHICPSCKGPEHHPVECDNDGICPSCQLSWSIPRDDMLRLNQDCTVVPLSIHVRFFAANEWDRETAETIASSPDEAAQIVRYWLMVLERPSFYRGASIPQSRADLMTMEVKYDHK